MSSAPASSSSTTSTPTPTSRQFKKDYYGGTLMVLIGLAAVVFWWALQLQLPLFTWGG